MNRFQIQPFVGFLLMILFLGISATTYAQPGDPGGDPDVPITGIEYLLGIGGLYGLKKIMDKSKKKTNE